MAAPTFRLTLCLGVIALFSTPSILGEETVAAGSSETYADTQLKDRVFIPGGTFTMGAGAIYREEGPPTEKQVTDFWIDKHEVTNRQFRAFVEATGYVTVVERDPKPEHNPGISPELLVAGSAVFTPPGPENPRASWWAFVQGANWAAPTGPGSGIENTLDHPVVHISYEDALAYAEWVGGFLPREDQWEYAARGGLDGATYSWGETPPQKRVRSANTWQGIFPVVNTNDDGHEGAAPVGSYEPNGFGLHDMTGNVWEWVRSDDETELSGRIKGGSYLCSDNFCRRYRPAARHAQEKNFSASHIGFRVAYDAEK